VIGFAVDGAVEKSRPRKSDRYRSIIANQDGIESVRVVEETRHRQERGERARGAVGIALALRLRTGDGTAGCRSIESRSKINANARLAAADVLFPRRDDTLGHIVLKEIVHA
jgi:hypothetical protein